MQARADITDLTDEQVLSEAAKALDEKIKWSKDNNPEVYHILSDLNFRDKRQIAEAVYGAVRELSVLTQVIDDPDVTEVMINGYENIFVEKAGVLTKLESHFESRRELEVVITKFVSEAGRAVNESEPIVDTRLKDGSRVKFVLPPLQLTAQI